MMKKKNDGEKIEEVKSKIPKFVTKIKYNINKSIRELNEKIFEYMYIYV